MPRGPEDSAPKQRGIDTPSEPRAARFDWHADRITRTTPVTQTYRNTQNVRRFLRSQCGDQFKFDRPFMQWIKNGTEKTMGDVADEWLHRRSRHRLSFGRDRS